MATPPQLTHLAFAAGIDESQQSEVLDPANAFRVLQNVRQDRRGGVSKRLGYDALTLARLDATSRDDARRLLMHRNSPCVIDGTYLDSYSAGTDVNATRGRVPEVSVTTRATTSYSAVDAQGYTLLWDCAVCGDYIVYAQTSWVDAYLSVEDLSSGTVMRAPELIYTTGDPLGLEQPVVALATYSTYVIAIFVNSAGSNITAYYLNTATAATITTGWVSMGNIATNHDVTPSYALSTQSLSNRVAFAYVNDSAGTSQVTVKTLTIAGVTETATVNTSSVTPSVVALEGSISDTLWVAWNETTAVKIKGLDADNLAVSLATTATLLTLVTSNPVALGVVSSATAGRGRIISFDGQNRVQMRSFRTTTGAAATDGSQVTVMNAMFGCRPFRNGTRYYAWFCPAPGNILNAQQVAVLCDFTDDNTWLRPVANVAPSLAVLPYVSRMHVESLGSSRFVTPLSVATSGAAHSGALVTLDFADRKRWQVADHNGVPFFTGGLLSSFDGVRIAENGFVVRPPKPTAVDSGGGTGPTGTVRYVLVYEESDGNGHWTASGISDPSASVTVTDNTITVTVRFCSISGRIRRTDGPEVRAVLYRTDVTGVPPYYRLTALDNDTSVVTATYSDTTADVTANRQLYSPNLPGSGSAQDRRAPPFNQAIASYSGMLVVASGSDLWWSGQTVSGEGTWFNPAFSVPVEGQGDLTALASQDGTLYAFKRRSVYSIAGEAPSDNGASGGLGTPRRLACDVGCIDPSSVVVTSLGVFFQSERGIELLNRGGAVTWIGEAIQDTLAAYPVVSSAVLDTKNGLVRFSLAESESDGVVSGDGRDLVYDLSLGAWQSVDAKFPVEGGDYTASQDAAMLYIDGSWRYAWIDAASGTLYYERDADDASAHLDGSDWITMAAETGSFKSSGIQGTQQLNHVLALARKSTDHDLSLSLAYNYETTFRTARDWTDTEINGLLSDGWPITQLKHEPHDDSVCQSVRLRMEDATPTDGTVGDGKGSTWIALTLDITPKPGVFDVPEEAA